MYMYVQAHQSLLQMLPHLLLCSDFILDLFDFRAVFFQLILQLLHFFILRESAK